MPGNDEIEVGGRGGDAVVKSNGGSRQCAACLRFGTCC
eukprot:CAMPEP_0206468150 /NCGR_PEP_ID=MMETSP0324_2-20121206/29447_1 /ASSEMBLY_ACC=CAM_ASM_000836 /TAXON_ID=2866 /ORGANISM="Crypthecodinium cohnii, Strain Seligo" /LENGTH=37 /DNA_ID= /DNA_START= /DNA_END= /DNA_ORIENTATION=